ncbi:MAG: polyribonucleotide nucleotidyltransferase [Armatimonadetes bacterium]|nr:polyribonucleotide nucleotidyltransferase [Armatimonadota bacterium]
MHTHTFEVGGKTISVETGRVAKQAGGAVLLGCGETVVLATATMSKAARPGIDFLPLTCDYEERKYSVGKIPGGFIKRGGRPSDRAVLTSRLIDRPLRPLFPKGLRNDVQVICLPFAVDQNFPPDVLAITAAGAALTVSDVPFAGPVAGVRVGRGADGKFILFPSIEEIAASDLDLCVAGHKNAISMVEAGATEVTEEDMIKALKFAHDGIKVICAELEKFGKMVNTPKREGIYSLTDEDLIKSIEKGSSKALAAAICNPDKANRESALDDLTKSIIAEYTTKNADKPELIAQIAGAVDYVMKKTVRKLVMEEDKRSDGRKLDEIRMLEAIPGILPKVHGSGLFTRGQTQVLTVLTLGMPGDAQTMDGIEDEPSKRYMHFYNFPPYSVGECRPLRGAGRREVGHGALAERALKSMVPLDDPDFPYTCLLMSECLESNGSTSMASVCGSTLALMDAGVPLKAPVAGIAMGLMSDGKNFKVLTDIQGMEDFCGDMDFKVAGTKDGITALQLDTKLDGIPDKVLADALAQAKRARLQVLQCITDAISEPRSEISTNAPRVTTIQINPEKIGALIGPGGATIRRIVAETGAQIDVQQDGRVLVAATEGHAALAAIEQIKAVTMSAEVGAEFTGTVTRLMGRGAMVEYMAGKEGLVPTEHLTTAEIRRPDDVVSAGDRINVKVFEVDSQGRVNLTALGLEQSLPALAGNINADPSKVQRPQREERGGFGGRGGGDRGGRGGGDRDRGGRSGGGDRGGYRDRDRGPREDAPREAVTEVQDTRSDNGGAPSAPDSFPGRGGNDDVNSKFRPRR